MLEDWVILVLLIKILFNLFKNLFFFFFGFKLFTLKFLFNIFFFDIFLKKKFNNFFQIN